MKNLESSKEWLEEFEHENGRPLKILHFGNIANNAYNNAKVHRAMGIEADVVAPGYYHIMGCPEWEDANIVGEIKDPFLPDFWSVKLGGFKRPKWFVQGPAPLVIEYLLHKADDDSLKTEIAWKKLQIHRYALVRPYMKPIVPKLIIIRSKYRNLIIKLNNLKNRINFKNRINLKAKIHSVSNKSKKVFAFSDKLAKAVLNRFKTNKFVRIFKIKILRLQPNNINSHEIVDGVQTETERVTSHASNISEAIDDIVKSTSPEVYPDDLPIQDSNPETPTVSLDELLAEQEEKFRELHDISLDDYIPFHANFKVWEAVFEKYDLVLAYSTDPIWPFLGQMKNYAAYEHGTIREIPFNDDAVGRLTMRAYKAAPAVFITNVDNIIAADKMGLTQEQRFYLPHAFDCNKLIRYAEECDVKFTKGNDKQIFMPSRQHWVDNDPNWAKGNDIVIRAAALLKQEDIKAQFKFVEWGNDIEASKKLMQELDVEDMFSWSPMLNKQQLWEEYLKSLVVIDQFLLPGISGVSFEAMTLGAPVITHDKGDLNKQFFGKAPPFLSASTPEKVASHIKKLLQNEDLRETIGNKSTQWILDYHSPERIFDIQIEGFKRVLANAD